jgi:hypothetical protein
MSSTCHPFTLDELRRLAVYRAAVQAGFYTDSLATTLPCDGTARYDRCFLNPTSATAPDGRLVAQS